jgi:hypothetical protein
MMIRRFTMTLCAALMLVTLSASPVSALAAPTSVTAESMPGTGSITVNWNSVTGADRHRVRVGIGTNSNKITIKTATVFGESSTKFTFTGLDFNISYTLSVQSGDGSTWSTRQYASSPLTLQLNAPVPPAQPSIRAIDDGVFVVEWSEPTESGGAEITSYSVQIYKGTTAFGEPQSTTSRILTAKTGDSGSTFSATVIAVNAGGIASKESRRSDGLQAVRPATNSLTRTPSPAPAPTPSPVVPIAPTPSESKPVAPTPNQTNPTLTVTPSYTKVIKAKATTSSKTLLSLSKLPTPKGSKTSLSVAASSRKICQLKGTSVKNTAKGTCSVKVTVTTKSGKKTSRTVKLVAR